MVRRAKGLKQGIEQAEASGSKLTDQNKQAGNFDELSDWPVPFMLLLSPLCSIHLCERTRALRPELALQSQSQCQSQLALHWRSPPKGLEAENISNSRFPIAGFISHRDERMIIRLSPLIGFGRRLFRLGFKGADRIATPQLVFRFHLLSFN